MCGRGLHGYAASPSGMLLRMQVTLRGVTILRGFTLKPKQEQYMPTVNVQVGKSIKSILSSQFGLDTRRFTPPERAREHRFTDKYPIGLESPTC